MWWNDGTATGLATPYQGIVCSHDDETGQFQICYDADGTQELLDFETLEVQGASANSMDDMGVRVQWMLVNSQGDHLTCNVWVRDCEDEGSGL